MCALPYPATPPPRRSIGQPNPAPHNDSWADHRELGALPRPIGACTLSKSLGPIMCILNGFLQEAPGKISLTSDVWTDPFLRPFMALTAHWIARDHTRELKLTCALIAFYPLPGSHTGENMAAEVMYLLRRAGIVAKVRNLYFLISVGNIYTDRCLYVG